MAHDQESQSQAPTSSLHTQSIIPNPSEEPSESNSINTPITLRHTKTNELVDNLNEAKSDSHLRIGIFVITYAVTIPLFFVSNLTSYQQRAIVMAVFYFQWIGYVFFELYSSSKVSALRIIYRQVKGFGNAIFPMGTFQIYDKPIESVSEFAGTRGSSLYVSMLMMSIGTSVLMMTCLKQRYQELNGMLIDNYDYIYNCDVDDKSDNSGLNLIQNIGIFTGVICATGFGFIGVFELNGYSKINAALHYIGVIMIAFGNVLFAIVVDYNIFYLLLPIVGIIIGSIYIWCTEKYAGKGKFVNDRDKIHKISLISVVLELIFIVVAAIINVISVFNLDKL